jgi:hypothetical protein
VVIPILELREENPHQYLTFDNTKNRKMNIVVRKLIGTMLATT